jgi:hypothetical protein
MHAKKWKRFACSFGIEGLLLVEQTDAKPVIYLLLELQGLKNWISEMLVLKIFKSSAQVNMALIHI